MTVAPHSPLVEAAVKAMAKVDSDDVGSSLSPEEYEPYAQAVVASCHAEEMHAALQLLLAAIGRLPVRIMTGELTDAVLAADAVLKVVEQQP